MRLDDRARLLVAFGTLLTLSLGLRALTLAIGPEVPAVMAVLNVTPDSFSDGGKYMEPDRAFARAIELEEQGADIIDVGAESTRPGAERVSEAECLARSSQVQCSREASRLRSQ